MKLHASKQKRSCKMKLELFLFPFEQSVIANWASLEDGGKQVWGGQKTCFEKFIVPQLVPLQPVYSIKIAVRTLYKFTGRNNKRGKKTRED